MAEHTYKVAVGNGDPVDIKADKGSNVNEVIGFARLKLPIIPNDLTGVKIKYYPPGSDIVAQSLGLTNTAPLNGTIRVIINNQP